MCCSPSGRNLSGETILAIIALVGGFALSWHGGLKTAESLWMFCAFLGIIILFYFLILMCRAMHNLMAGDGTFWWEKYENHKNSKK